VAGVLEQMRVSVEGDRDARVAEDAADLGYVEPEVDDQVLAKVWRWSWKRSRGQPSSFSPAGCAARPSARRLTLRWP
jgi:hypothetical protein